MRFDLKRVAEFIHRADTEELLDRVTVYREGMEPAALDLMEGELDRRGITRGDIADHDAERRRTAIMLPDGTAVRCSLCNRPAIVEARGWHRLFGVLPIFPRLFAYCSVHQQLKQPQQPGRD
jgi:LSD1 subclass zinc finger protein